jgi:hypothetical protein
MPSDCQLAITETVADRLAPIALFQGTLGGLLTTTKCHQTLVDYLPLWAYKFVVKHMVQPKPVQKLTFTLCPAVDSQLPTLPAG